MKPSAAPQVTPRAVLYLRQSTHREDSISMELQEAAGREYCTRRGYEVVGVEADPGISGRTWKRPAVLRVMESVAAGAVDVVVLWKWSRLSRSRLDWAVAVDKVESAGGRIESATEPLDTTSSTGRLARGMMAEFAAFESERIGDGWRETHERRRRHGLPAQGGPRFGYQLADGAYTPDETQGPLLAEMYRRYLAGAGFTRITRWANAEGHRTTAGGEWTRPYVSRLLDSGFGAGRIMKRGATYSDLIYYPGAHPSLITEDEWVLYRSMRGSTRTHAVPVEPKFFLSGLIRCDDCEAPMHSANGAGKPKSTYVCSAWARGKGARCVTCVRSKVEEFVLAWLRSFAAEIESAASVEARTLARRVTATNDAGMLDAAIAKIDRTLGKLTVAWLAGDVIDAAYHATTAALAEKRAGFVARQQSATRNVNREVDLSVVALTIARWGELEVLEQRELLASLIREVRVIPPDAVPRGGNTRAAGRTVTFRVVPKWEPAGE